MASRGNFQGDEFQGGDFVSVLPPKGQDPAARWRRTGKIDRPYDKKARTHAYHLKDSSTRTSFEYPSEKSEHSSLTQPYLILQLQVPSEHGFALELGIVDEKHEKRRIHMSTACREIKTIADPPSAQLPLPVERDEWVNLCLDVRALLQGCFAGAAEFKAIHTLTIRKCCLLRSVFTMRCVSLLPRPAFPAE